MLKALASSVCEAYSLTLWGIIAVDTVVNVTDGLYVGRHYLKFSNRTSSNSLNGLICLHSVLDKAGSQSVFKRT